MKTKIIKTVFIVTWVVIILGNLAIGFLLALEYANDNTGEIVDCYDKYGNRIINVKCEGGNSMSLTSVGIILLCCVSFYILSYICKTMYANYFGRYDEGCDL